MITFIIGAVAALAVWLCLSPRVSPFLYSRFLFHPSKERGHPEDLLKLVELVSGHEVYFMNRRGNRLHGWYFGDPRVEGPVLFYSMGKDGDIARRAETISLLLQTGASVFIYEYAGYGSSEGKPSYQGLLHDARDAYDFLVDSIGVDPDNIVFYGESLGCAISCWLMGYRRARGVVLKSGFSSLMRVAREKLPLLNLYPAALFPQPLLDNAAALSQADVPSLIIHGAGDRMINAGHPQRLLRAAKGSTRFLNLPESRHSHMSDDDKIRLRDGVAEFLRSIYADSCVA